MRRREPPIELLPPLGAPDIAHERDATWRELTEAGNAALARGETATALTSYEMALTEAERLFACAREETSALLLAPMTLTITLSNLAELRRRARDRDGAFRLKWRAVERLLEIAGDPSAHAALRLNCVRHLKYAFAFLAEDSGPSRQAELTALAGEARLVVSRALEDLRNDGGRHDGLTPPDGCPVRH